MPHLIANYSENIKDLKVKELLLNMNKALFSTGLFATSEEIKSRGQCNYDVVIGLDSKEEAYLHIILYILSGRNDEEKDYLSRTLLKTVEQEITTTKREEISIQICIEVTEIDRKSYNKKII
ncbi:5-carboxymethyl-2-hydroxymuconate isomerase [Acinetobacter sp. B10A]|uniref:5-carboxymethyl-2-hydroxymuconate Delta-isomerase n=1 Tax=Acinetobacter baretiae TaxID=2605383 RepID=UPI001B3C6924|nr:5-carboxymethyl-2-hydroxymuconate isomerase [Acinetobacter baretiae]MBF7686253.1 5-carboxymethyl-2-hydroxymuconate isomerase [Acinetobacter baretiae]